MKILLISPKCEYFSGGSMYFPLGLAYISSSLRKIKASVKFIDFEIDTHSQEKLNSILENWEPEYIAFSVHYACFNMALSLARDIKQKTKKSKLVSGGISPTTFPESFLKENLFDFVIRGDGEFPFTQLVQNVSLDEITGLCYINSIDGKIHISGTNYQPYKLETLPFPDYETIPFNNYRSRLGGNFYLPSYPILASRGCTGVCTFCTSYDFNKKYRTRNPDDVISEIQMAIKTYNAKEIRFLDGTFTENKEYIYKLCEKIIDRKLPIHWSCSTRIDRLDKELLNIMKKSGCISIGFGLESGNTGLLKKINKSYSIEEALSLLDYCAKLRIFTKGSFMYGLPGETKKTLDDTLNYAMKAALDFPVFNFFNLPLMISYNTGTPIEKEYHNLKKLKAQDSLLPLVSTKKIHQHILKSYFLFYFRFSTIKKFLTRKIYFVFFIHNIFRIFPFILLSSIKHKIQKALKCHK